MEEGGRQGALVDRRKCVDFAPVRPEKGEKTARGEPADGPMQFIQTTQTAHPNAWAAREVFDSRKFEKLFNRLI
jgi:hypothetical protein